MNVWSLVLGATLGAAALYALAPRQETRPVTTESHKPYPVQKSDAEWRKWLTPEEYEVARKAGTERAFTGKYWNNHESGQYLCVGCGQELFTSDTKFDSGSGWPSYWKPVSASAIEERRDSTHGMVRTEVICTRCGSHLGHLFEDGPKPTGLRYCINSASLRFKAK